MDNDLIDDTGVNILNIFFNKHLHEIKANINKGDKFPVWDGELLVYKSEKRNNKNIKGKISVQIKSTSKKDKLDFFSFDKTTLEKYMIDSGILILRPLANLDLLEPPIYYKFLFSTELKTIIRSNNFTIKFDKITDPKQFLNECYYFIEERPRQSNTENIISFEDIIRNDKNISFTMTTPFGMDLDSAIKTGKHNLYYKLLSKYELPINEKITKISPKVTSNIFVNEKQYFQDFIKEITYNENLRLKFNSVLTFELNNNKSIDLKLNINEASIVSDFVTALDFLYDTKEKGHFSIDKNIFNIQTLNLPSHLKNEHEYFKTLLTLFDILRIPYKNLSFNDIENIDINTLKNLIYFLILKGNVTANSQDQLLYQSFTILDREFIFLFEAIKDNSFKPIFLNYEFESDNKLEITLEDNKKYPASKFLFYLHTNNVKPMKGFFDIILSDLIKRYDSKLSSPYTSLLLLCIKFYDKEHDIDFLKFSLQLIDNILKLEKENRIISVYSINKYQILKRMRSLNKKEKEHIVTIKNEYILDIEFQLCCSILLDETSITSKKLDTLKLENTNRYEQFTKYPIYSLFLSLNEKT